MTRTLITFAAGLALAATGLPTGASAQVPGLQGPGRVLNGSYPGIENMYLHSSRLGTHRTTRRPDHGNTGSGGSFSTDRPRSPSSLEMNDAG
jgi:hypothetical protein